MYWIALWPSHDEERTAWGWHALQFTPRVAWVDEALLLEVAASERLWGGRKRLLRRFLDTGELLASSPWATAETSLVALALLRLKQRGEPAPAQVPDALALELLTAAREHVGILERIGCRTWGDLRRLPRAGVVRRFGAPLLEALDHACGDRPERYAWISAPESFDVRMELAALATSAPELMWTAQRLLSQLQLWLRARHRGVLALELEWTLDLRRLNGKALPANERLQIRTAQPAQDMVHLRRLVSEHLSRATLSAPANHLRLRSLETAPWPGLSTSLLPEDNKPGEKLHEFVERLSARLGEHGVLVNRVHSDHRPERMQSWVPAKGHVEGSEPAHPVDALYPSWLLPEPVLLEMRGDTPCHGGPLRRLARLYRVETGWWEEGGPACRDYFIARSEEAGLVWIYRERPGGNGRARWYLQGLYA